MGKLFISYRRDDTQDLTRSIYERLEARFGKDNIFMDVDSIPLGADFRQILRDWIAESTLALVIIGKFWLSLTDAHGQRRLDTPNDFVRIEVEEALSRRIPVVPLLAHGVSMPRPSDLPDSIADLAYRHGTDVRSDQHFNHDVEQLISRLAPLMEPKPSYPLPSVPARLASLGFRGVNVTGTPAIESPLVSVAAGPFLMGSDPARDPVAKEPWAKNETPQDWVELAAFQIGTYPVTVAEYALAVRAGAVHEAAVEEREILGMEFPAVTWQMQLQRPDHPVVCVSWQDATAYVAWLCEVTGQSGWRLPSEAQWEKAARWDARQGVSRIYPWGDSFDKHRCNTNEGGIKTTTPIGSYPANDLRRSGASPSGAEEMAGNVWEWTSSLYKPYKYIENDGREDQDSTASRVLRGGSWSNTAWNARAACRDLNRWGGLNLDRGFRLAFAPSAGS